MPDDHQPGVLRVLSSRQEVRAFYDKISSFYDALAERSEAPVRAAGLEMLDVAAGQSVLEIGCGTGQSLVELSGAVGPAGSVVGVDLSAGMVRAARARLADAGVPAHVMLVLADAVALPFAAGRFDAAFMSFTLELFDTPEMPAVLAECRRVLQPGGRLGVVGLSKGEGGLAVHAFEWTHRHFPNLLDCRPIYVARALEDAGFRIGARRLMHMWVPVEVVVGVSAT